MSKKKPEIKIMPHTYDGIQEYDQRLPNWWLFTLYGAIIFSIGYWFIYFQARSDDELITALTAEMDIIEAEKLASAISDLDDEKLWSMSRSDAFVSAGQKVYEINCVSCHGQSLEGGIGFPLDDSVWVHGGKPMEIMETVTYGVPDKGMQAWESVLGQKKIAEAVSYILSKHERAEDDTAQ